MALALAVGALVVLAGCAGPSPSGETAAGAAGAADQVGLAPDPPSELRIEVDGPDLVVSWAAPSAGQVVTGYRLWVDLHDAVDVEPAPTRHIVHGAARPGSWHQVRIVSLAADARSTDVAAEVSVPHPPPVPPVAAVQPTPDEAPATVAAPPPVPPAPQAAPAASRPSGPSGPSGPSAGTDGSTPSQAAPQAEAAPVRQTIVGTLHVRQGVDSRLTAGCGGYGRFATFQVGTPVVVTDLQGATVGEGRLEDCTWRDAGSQFGLGAGGYQLWDAVFTYSVPVVETGTGYVTTVSWKTWSPVTQAQLLQQQWTDHLAVQ